MSRRGEFQYWIEAVLEDGSTKRFAIHKKGRSWWIDDHLVHPSAQSVEAELRVLFRVRSTRLVLPGEADSGHR